MDSKEEIKDNIQLQDIAKVLEADKLEADQDFKRTLKAEMLKTLDKPGNPPNLTFILNFMKNKNVKIALALSVLLGLSAVIAGSSFLIQQNQKNKANEIFAAMLAAGNNRTAASAESDKIAFDQAGTSTASLIAPPENKTYNYYSAITTSGPKSQTCNTYIPYGLAKTESESIYYYNQDQGSFSKYVTKDQDGNIYQYYLSDADFQYEYSGGSFAVKTPAFNYSTLLEAQEDYTKLDETTSSLPAEDAPLTEPIPAETPQDYFGPDAQVLGEETINGKKHYIVQWSYDNYCSDTLSSTKVFSKVWVDALDYSYSKEEIYLGSISAENLIVSSIYSNESSLKEYSEVSSEFNFDLNVSIREIDPDEYAQGSEKYLDLFRSMLSSNQINFMNIQNGYKIDSYFASKLDLPDPYSFRLEREFYLGGSLGDKLFEENTNNFIVDDTNSSYLTVNFSKNEQDTYKNFSFEIYDMSVNEEDIYGEISNIAAENTSIKIDGVSTPIKLFDLSKQVFDDTQRDGGGIDGTLPGAADGSEGSEPSIVYHSYIGTIIDGNYKYFLRFDGNLDINEISELSIINISSSTSTGIDQIVDLIKDIKFNDFIAL